MDPITSSIIGLLLVAMICCGSGFVCLGILTYRDPSIMIRIMAALYAILGACTLTVGVILLTGLITHVRWVS